MARPTNAALPPDRGEPRSRTALLLESVALRHQIAVPERSRYNSLTIARSGLFDLSNASNICTPERCPIRSFMQIQNQFLTPA